MNGPSHILEVEDLTVRYRDGVQALRGVSLRVPQASRVGLIGPNGAGKTTLLLAVMGGVRYEGRIVVDGIELAPKTAEEARNRCGMIFESPDDQLFMPTLLEDVAFGPLNQGFEPEQAAARSRQAIAAVGLSGLEQRPAHHLSAGQKRSAALATVLSMNVRLLLLDEPASGLDARARGRLIDLLGSRPEAMLIATHDLGFIKALCSRVAVLDAGRVVLEAPTDQVLGDADLLLEHGLR